MMRSEIIRDSLSQRGALIHCADKQEALALANRIAPEHLELAVQHPEDWVDGVHLQGPYVVALIPAKLLATMWPGLLTCYRPLAPLVLPRPLAYTTFRSELRSCRCQPMGPVHCLKSRIRWRKPKGCLPACESCRNCVAAPIRMQTESMGLRIHQSDPGLGTRRTQSVRALSTISQPSRGHGFSPTQGKSE